LTKFTYYGMIVELDILERRKMRFLYRKSYGRHVANAFGRYYARNRHNYSRPIVPSNSIDDDMAVLLLFVIGFFILVSGIISYSIY
jgi:hypothetical protein